MLPKLSLAFSTMAIASLQSLLVDSFDPPALSLPQDPPHKSQDLLHAPSALLGRGKGPRDSSVWHSGYLVSSMGQKVSKLLS
jgi:hypothetical protein